MRRVLALLLATSAFPAVADTITAESTVTAVTVYPDGARITREVVFTAPSAGAHDLLVTDLPGETDPSLLQLQGDEGLIFGAFSLRADRLPPRAEALTPEQEAARAAVETAEAAERAALAAIEAIQARVAAANAQAAFLSSFAGALPENATPDSVKAMAAMIGAETLAASETAAAARAELWPAQEALEEAQKARADAQAAYDALPARDADYTALAVSVEVAAAGEARMQVTHYVYSAAWRPFYGLNLTRGGEGLLTIDRSVLVSQYTGEDWAGVALTLSTARPSAQAAPTVLWPDLRRIMPEPDPEALARDSATGAGYAEADAVAEPSAAPAPVTAAAGLEGDTVVYNYPRPVDVASGVEDLRLALDVLTAPPVVTAVATPRWDGTAFVMAEFVNDGTEPLLPGDALLYREGVLVGSTVLDTIAPGAEAEIAFGALETMVIAREMPERDSGQSGFLTTSNEASETAVITVENLGAESWPVRVIDQIPYSEQEDLAIELVAEPPPTETDPEGQRGLLAWEFDLAGGAKTEISVGFTMSWPEGMVLQ